MTFEEWWEEEGHYKVPTLNSMHDKKVAHAAWIAATEEVGSEIMDMRYCESRKLLLRIDQLYRFTPDSECESCQALKRKHDEAYGGRDDV